MRGPIPHLSRRAEFLRVAAARRKWAAPGLVLQVAARADTSGPRVGFTASKKVGNAVARNRARRRLRAAIAAVAAGRVRDDIDLVAIARDKTPTRPWPALLADLEQALTRLKAWR
ncbi:MAG: ribonuclease P protein component [Alphaproteobacteria bacterium]|nr:MAG: ribonuclease P protein component [Alphaproteobacteria bacterium]